MANVEGSHLYRSTRQDVVRFPTTGLPRADVLCLTPTSLRDGRRDNYELTALGDVSGRRGGGNGEG